MASSSETDTRAIFLLAASLPPYAVYCNPFYHHAGFGTVFSTTSSGKLESAIQHFPYYEKASIHGMVFDKGEKHLYSADMWGNKIWTHQKLDSKEGEEEGKVGVVGYVDAPDVSDRPRWVEMHRSGQYLYVLMEKGNRLCEFKIDPQTRLPAYTNRSFPLIDPSIPENDKHKLYRADVCVLSHSQDFLFATSRANSFDLKGYISVFEISHDGRIEKQLVLQKTKTSGGHSNVCRPSDWCDDWVVITDDEEGWVEVYKWDAEGGILKQVAEVLIGEKGFGMNSVWLD